MVWIWSIIYATHGTVDGYKPLVYSSIMTHDLMIMRTHIVRCGEESCGSESAWRIVCQKGSFKLDLFLLFGVNINDKNHLQRLFVWKRVPNQCIPGNGASPTSRVVPISIHHRSRSSTNTASLEYSGALWVLGLFLGKSNKPIWVSLKLGGFRSPRLHLFPSCRGPTWLHYMYFKFNMGWSFRRYHYNAEIWCIVMRCKGVDVYLTLQFKYMRGHAGLLSYTVYTHISYIIHRNISS